MKDNFPISAWGGKKRFLFRERGKMRNRFPLAVSKQLTPTMGRRDDDVDIFPELLAHPVEWKLNNVESGSYRGRKLFSN